MIQRVFIFRHGETDWNAEGRFQGHTDVPLNDHGRTQASALIPVLQACRIQAILSSDLSRARETAQIVASELGIQIFQDAGIREANLGHAQGLTIAEMSERFGSEIWDRWKSNELTDADVSFPDGESGYTVIERAMATIERFLLAHPEWDAVGVSTHGGVIRRVMQKILPPGSPSVKIPNCVVYELNFDSEKRTWAALSLPEPLTI